MKRLFTLTIISIFILLATGCTINKTQEIIRPVQYTIVHSGSNIADKIFFGYLKSSSLTDLSFQIEGTLKKVYVNEGQTVTKGQIIAELDAPLYHIQVQEAQYALSDAIIQYQNAKSYYDRIKKLHAAGGISDNDTDNARTKMESANYQIQIAREKLNYMIHRSGYERIYAPTNGIILSKVASEQQYLNPGSTVVQFQGSEDVEAYVFVSQNYINKISHGQKAKVKVDAIKNKVFDAQVKEISQKSLEQLSYRVKLKIFNQTPNLKDGMSASANFEISGSEKNQILIPVNSLIKEGDKNIVFTITERNNNLGTIKKNFVETGELNGDRIVIKNGLNDGDYVVTRGVSEVQEGQRVKY